jgi:hypothetical protein
MHCALLQTPPVHSATFSTFTAAEWELRLCTFLDSVAVARDCVDELSETPNDDEYYQDNLGFAKDAVKSAIEEFNSLLKELSEDDKQLFLSGHGSEVTQLQMDLERAIKDGQGEK